LKIVLEAEANMKMPLEELVYSHSQAETHHLVGYPPNLSGDQDIYKAHVSLNLTPPSLSLP
jgi:hypothetical protein